MKSNGRSDFDTTSVIINLSGWKIFRALVGGIISGTLTLLLMALFYFIAADGNYVGWVLFGLQSIIFCIIVWAVFQTFRLIWWFKKLYIRLDGEGLLYSFHNQFIPWKHVQNISVRRYKRKKWVEVYFEVPPQTERTKVLRLQNSFKIDPDQLCKLLESWRERYCDKESINSSESISRLLPG